MVPGSILIVDDDPDITEAMTVVLENKGHEVHSTLNGAEAGDRTWLPVDDFLDEPVRPEVLLEEVRSLIPKP